MNTKRKPKRLKVIPASGTPSASRAGAAGKRRREMRETIFDRLVKCLELTASDQEGEALVAIKLVAIKKSNEIRESLGLTWTDILTGNITDFEPEPSELEPEVSREEMFGHIWRFNPPTGKWRKIIRDIEIFADKRGCLTPKQEKLVRKFYEGALERMSRAE